MSRRFNVVLCGMILGLLSPALVFAMQQTTWDFRNGNMPVSWTVQNLSADPRVEGLELETAGQGGIVTDLSLPQKIDAVRLIFSNTEPGNMLFIWHGRKTPANSFTQLPVAINGLSPETMELNMRNFPQWDPQPTRIGLAFDKGGHVVLSEIQFLSWNPIEKWAAAFTSFWTFDTFRSYSINFLWGPIITFNPVGQSHMFEHLPPFGWSANRVFYGVILLAAAALFGHGFWKGKKRRGLLIFFSVVGVLWLLFDVRMGAELLSYDIDDYARYISKPAGEGIFRNYQEFYSLVETGIASMRPDEQKLLFVEPAETRFSGLVRYLAYPHHLLFADEPTGGVRTWIVFRRPDLTVGPTGALMQDGKEVSPPGTIIREFDTHSFVFQTP